MSEEQNSSDAFPLSPYLHLKFVNILKKNTEDASIINVVHKAHRTFPLVIVTTDYSFDTRSYLTENTACTVYMNQQDAQLLTNNLYFSLFCSTCSGRTIRPSSAAPSSELYHAFGTFVQASLAAT